MSHQPEEAGPDLLATIVAATRRAVGDRERRCSTAQLATAAASIAPGGDRFRAALARPGVNVIAECKRRSPSRGILRADYQPAEIAAAYEANGAAAISVLTESTFFDGSLDDLRAVRAAVAVPVLRKDFVVTPYQLLEAVVAGADAVLLIVAALDDGALVALFDQATSLGLGVLMEVHDPAELSRALAIGAPVIGVNNRNLRTLAVDLDASRSLIGQMPRDTVGVAESGLKTSADLVSLGAAGYRAFLMGETLITTPDPGATLARVLAGAARPRGPAPSARPVEAGGA